MRQFFCCLGLCLFCLPLFATPKVGLVLSGGGARGFAHIGVLKFLEEEHIRVDCLAGTSMGALVASGWNAGLSPEVMEQELSAVNWADLFHDAPEFSEIPPVRRRLEYNYLDGYEIGVDAKGLHYPSAMVSGQKIKLFFNHLLNVKNGEPLIENLPLPFAIIATDIGTGERVEIKKGSVTTAMRASMSVPGLLAPVDYQKRKLVDGGLVDNLPIESVQKLCAPDIIIAINVGTPLLPADKVNSIFSISTQMVGILTEQNVAQSLKLLRKKDIYLKLPLENISPVDFARVQEIAKQGYAFMREHQALFLKLKSPPAAWQKWHARLQPQTKEHPIGAIEIADTQNVSKESIQRYFPKEEWSHLSEKNIEKNIQRIYAEGFFDKVDYSVLSGKKKNILRILPIEKAWGPNYLRFAIHLNASSQEGSRFNLKTAYHKTWLNPLGGEFLSELSIGDQWHFRNIWYQPLNVQQQYFVQMGGKVSRETVPLYQRNDKVAEYTHDEYQLNAALGKNWEVLGDVQLGWHAKTGRFKRHVGSLTEWLPQSRYHVFGSFLKTEWEQFDRLYFPRRGWSLKMRYFHAHNRNYSRLDWEAKTAMPILPKTIWSNRLQYVGSPKKQLPYFDAAYLGGFQNMTALAPYELWGDNLWYFGTRMERILGEMPFGKSDVRLGIMAEAARSPNGFARAKKHYIDSVSVYLGGETFLGPAFLGVGYSNALQVYNAFLFIGMP